MRHLSDGTLRRLYDEPLALAAAERRHYTTCAHCRGRFTAIAADARNAAELLAAPAGTVDHAAALAAVQRRVAATGGVRTRRWYHSPFERMTAMVGFSNRRLAKSAFGLVAAAALVGALALTPAGSLAQSFITIFEPTQFVAVPVAQSDVTSLQSLPNLQSFGTMTQLAQPATRQVAGASEAARTSGLTLRTPTWLPASVPSSVSYAVMTQGTASFTFSAAKASAAVTATGQRLPAMPAGLDGSTLQLTVGPAVVATYGGSVAPSSGATAGSSATSRSRLPTGSAVRPRIKRIGIKGLLTGRTAVAAAQHQGEIPALAILEAPQPRVTSTGASVADIENYLLAMPGVSPQLAAEIRSIGDPTTTLPVPIPIDRAIAQTVQIHGADGQDASGLLVGDNTGLGSGVVWESDGMVYAVAGSLPQDQIIRIAESLR